MYGPFGNLFPYSDQHALNLDWIIQVAKDFLDQYTHIQEIISDGETSLDQHTTDGLAALAAEKDRLEGLLNAWYITHSEDIANQLTAAVAGFRTQAVAIAAEVFEDMPESYTALSDSVTQSLKLNQQSIVLASDDYEVVRRWINDSNQFSTPASSSPIRATVVPIPTGCTHITISCPGTLTCSYAFLSASTGFPSGSGGPVFSESYSSRIDVSTEAINDYTRLNDMNYLYIQTINTSSENMTPAVTFYINAVKSIGEILFNETATLENGTVSNDSIDSSGLWASSSGSFQSSCVRVPAGTRMIKITHKNGTIVAPLASLTNRRSGGAADFAEGHSSRYIYSAVGSSIIMVDADCKWIYSNITTRDGIDVKPVISFQPDMIRTEDLPDNEGYTNNKIYGILPTLYEGDFVWRLGYSYLSGGSTNYADGFACTQFIDVVPGNQVINTAAATDGTNTINLYIVEFNNDTFIRRYSMAPNSKYIVPEGVNRIRLMYGWASSTEVTITKNLLSQYFSVKMLVTAMQNPWETPVYVAYGASTTIGAVHRFTGQGTYLSGYSYPDYIGKALHLHPYNHGHGTTGFLARADGTVPNIMDAIYADDTLLQNAGLVSIMFGYGNDRSAGLPIGKYTDYYPYDEEGYHPSGSDGITTMLEKGATLFGCLNWCIKWISEKYPSATLVIIVGSPSMNHNRTIIKSENPDSTGSNGLPPYTLSFTDPYSDTGIVNPGDEYNLPTSAQGVAQLKEEMPKLQQAMGIPIINLIEIGSNINYWNSEAKKDDNTYAIFSTTGTSDDESTWEWNSHPNDDGYKMFAQYIAGKIIQMYKHG